MKCSRKFPPCRSKPQEARIADRNRHTADCRRLRQIGTASALRLAAGRDGRPYAGLRPHPRRDHGHRRRVHGRALAPALRRAPTALTVVAIVGTLTAFFAATIGMVQTDIKRVLAYSTISQLGYMFLACGVAAYSAPASST